MTSDMRRREFITLVGSIAFRPLSARAEQRPKIGLLDTGLGTAFAVPFMGRLAELGYVDGKNILIERRSAEGNAERLGELAAELVRQQVNVIVTAGTPAAFAAKKATSTIPIVLGANSDPVGVGLVASLARPGGNITGNSLMAPDLSAKRLEIFHMLGPQVFLPRPARFRLCSKTARTSRLAGSCHTARLPRCVSQGGDLCRQDFEGRQPCGVADRAANEIRAGTQHEGRKGAWTRNSIIADRVGG